MLWKEPIYRFRIPKKGDEESDELKELIIDVTGSAPPFKEPSDNLKRILDEIFADRSLGTINNVVEFGAAKLKNIPYILSKGKKVCAVEFEALNKNALTKKNLKKCRKYKTQFQNMVFPNPFISDTNEFDIALLINVVPVMPVFAERLFLLQLLRSKVKKYILWVAQKEGSYKQIREAGKNICGDGIWMGKGRYCKTFYRYNSVEEVDELMALYGFERIRKFSGSDDAMLYKKIEHVPFEGVIKMTKIQQHVPVDGTIQEPDDPDHLKIVSKTSQVRPVLPNPRELSIETLYEEVLKSMPHGIDHAEVYHRLVSCALARIFRGALRNLEIKVEVNGGIQIIDAVFTNVAESGFFKNLRSKTECSNPIVEVKNISGDPTNVDIGQLNGRFNTIRGHFGILVCRSVVDNKAVLERCKVLLPNNYILVITDNEIIELLEHARENNQDEINDFMDKKLRALMF